MQRIPSPRNHRNQPCTHHGPVGGSKSITRARTEAAQSSSNGWPRYNLLWRCNCCSHSRSLTHISFVDRIAFVEHSGPDPNPYLDISASNPLCVSPARRLRCTHAVDLWVIVDIPALNGFGAYMNAYLLREIVRWNPMTTPVNHRCVGGWMTVGYVVSCGWDCCSCSPELLLYAGMRKGN